MALEEILVCNGMPNVEAVIDLRGDETFLVLRERHDPEHVLVERALDAETPPLKVVWDASEWDAARAKRVTSSTGPIVPA